MWMFYLEAVIALALLLLIVWWTLGPVRKRELENEVGTSHEVPAESAKPSQSD